MDRQRLGILLNKEVYEKLRLYCFENRISMNKFIEKIVAQKLDKKERK